MRNQPPNVYLQSYLHKAGVRFDPNVVDTIAIKGFGFSFYLFLALLIVLIGAYAAGTSVSLLNNFYLLTFLVLVYLLLYIYRVVRFRRIRKKLRLDNAPIVVEAYAIVLFDESAFTDKNHKPRRSAVLYKECGSLKPRFFTGMVKKGIFHHYYKDQIARVFIDRKNPALYSVDDDKFYKTASEKIRFGQKYAISGLATKLDKVGFNSPDIIRFVIKKEIVKDNK